VGEIITPKAENFTISLGDVIEIAAWHDSRSEGLDDRFVEDFLGVLNELTVNPLLHCRRHPSKNIRWRYPQNFPYRVIYEVVEDQKIVIVAAARYLIESEWLAKDSGIQTKGSSGWQSSAS